MAAIDAAPPTVRAMPVRINMRKGAGAVSLCVSRVIAVDHRPDERMTQQWGNLAASDFGYEDAAAHSLRIRIRFIDGFTQSGTMLPFDRHSRTTAKS